MLRQQWQTLNKCCLNGRVPTGGNPFTDLGRSHKSCHYQGKQVRWKVTPFQAQKPSGSLSYIMHEFLANASQVELEFLSLLSLKTPHENPRGPLGPIDSLHWAHTPNSPRKRVIRVSLPGTPAEWMTDVEITW